MKCEQRHIRGCSLALGRTGALNEEIPMPTSLGNKKQSDQDREELRTIWVFALTTFFVLAVAAFVGIIF
jgi:hypothetical protein